MDCIINDTVPDYKTAFYDYMIYRDVYVNDVPKFGKNPGPPNPANKVDLKLDVYIPCNVETSRPLVIIPRASHYSSDGGITSTGTTGKHRYILRELARRGFVGVALEYRSYKRVTSTGYYVDITPGPSNAIDSCAYDSYLVGAADNTDHFFRCYKCLYEAGYDMEAEVFKKWMMYINVQDVLSAVGYCTEDPKELGINADVNNVFIGGLSNGGQIALTAAYLDENEYVTGIENQIKNALGPLDQNGYADDLPSDFEFKGVFNFWGSTHDITHIDANDPTAYLVHGTWDDTVPYQDNYLGFESAQEQSHFYSYGSEAIACKLNEQGINFGLYSMYRVGHGAFPQIDPCTPGLICGIQWSDILIKKVANYMSKLVINNNYPIVISGINPQNYGCNVAISQTLILELYESDLAGNCIQNPAHFPGNLSQMLEYCDCEPVVLPSAELKAGFELFNTELDHSDIHIYPNPTNGHLQIDLLEAENNVRIYNVLGELVFETAIPGKIESKTLDLSDLSPGNYVLTTGLRSKNFIKQ